MRVVGGRLKGLALAGPKGTTRPTGDRLRETVFNILVHAFDDPVSEARVLDLFAGTGALGIEALSRGARFALFVDTATEARAVIRRNLESAGLAGLTRIWRRDATRLGPRGNIAPFTLCFLDPPYGRGLGAAALESAARHGWLAPDALAVLEEAAGALPDEIAGYELVDRREAGGSGVGFYRLAEATSGHEAGTP